MSDYDVNDLLSYIGGGSSEPKPIIEDCKLGQFYHDFKLKEGTCKVPNFVIYYTYKVKFGGDLSKVEFFRQLNKKYAAQKVRTGKQRYYKLEGNFDLSREGLIEAEFFEKEQK